MKSSNKSSIITGTVLLLLAAFFSISLLLQILDFGVGGPGHNNFLYILGNMLYTVYGFSSILIPIFLLYAGLSSFATTWTSQKTMHLITAIIPFFTAVITEKICRSIFVLHSNSSMIKMIIALITGAMLVVIEILGAGVMAETVNQKIFYKNKPRPTPAKKDDFENNDSETDNFKFENIKTSTFDKALSQVKVNTEPSVLTEANKPEDNTTEANPIEVQPANTSENNTDLANQIAETQKENANTEDTLAAINNNSDNNTADSEQSEENISQPEITPTVDTSAETLQDEEETLEEETFDESFQDLVALADDVYQEEVVEEVEEDIPTIDDYADIDKIQAEAKAAALAQAKADSEALNQKLQSDDDSDEESSSSNPGSIITQEEYAALINPADFEEPEVEELEWSNLPPVPETLPPEYIEDFDENDPALDFPPKDKQEENPYKENTIDLTNYSKTQTPVQESQKVQSVQEKDVQVNNQAANPKDSITQNESNDPYATTRFIDSRVHPNPAFPSEIILHDDEEKKPVESTTPKKVRTVPQYPSKISLEEDDDIHVPEIDVPEIKSYTDDVVSPNDIAQNQTRQSSRPMDFVYQSSVPQDTNDFEDDDYVEDVTLPEPNIENLRDPFLEDDYSLEDSIFEYETELQNPLDEENYTEPNNSNNSDNKDATLDPDFFDIDMNADEVEELSDEIKEVPEALTSSSSIFQQISQQETGKSTFSSAVSNVFSDMEADIQRQKPTKMPVQVTEKANPAKTESPFSKSSIDLDDLDPNANSANNLTADELEDFFFAQQQENTPKTREIEGNLPTTNQAVPKGPYVIPSDLLTAYKGDQYWIIDEQTKQASLNLKQTLAEFNIDADIIGIKKGPVVTMFELLPAPGVKLSKIVALQDNIALSLAASSVRIVAPIPGKQAVGIEVPNRERSIVSFRELIEMDLPEYNKMAVPVILGKDILGKAQLIDLVKTPHMLIAGATGSGKSVCVNSLILSILYKRSYKDVKLILVDPKVVELKLYNNIPHLLTPVITEPKRAIQALQYCLCEMERRYALLDGLGVRDISSYNQRIKERDICTEKLPYIVVIIDEFADLMATSGKELESIVARLTAMSRAVGIHLVLATQRPSVNVITGLIKANIPSRIAFMVASRTDSNIIIDSVGAEKLLGRGDMLYASAVDPYPVRIQGTFVSDSEVENVVEYVKQFGDPDYIDEEIFIDEDEGNDNLDLFGNPADEDPLYNQALEIVYQAGKASASYIQRRLKIGYNRAARLVEEMEERGIVGPANGSKPREIIHVQ